jgi:uncharacterized glyoxalase superfamily protein PhnB
MFKGGLRGMLYVRDVPTSVAFYTAKLGFQLEGSWGPDYASVRAAGPSIGLHAVAPGSAVAVGGAVLHYEVADVDAYYERLVRGGLAASEPRDEPWGDRMLYVRDPDGHEWGFFTPIAVPKAGKKKGAGKKKSAGEKKSAAKAKKTKAKAGGSTKAKAKAKPKAKAKAKTAKRARKK